MRNKIVGYDERIYKVLSEKETSKSRTWYLVEYEIISDVNCYAFGTLDEFKSMFFVPAGQFGTKQDLVQFCETEIEICNKFLEEYKQSVAENINTDGIKLLIDDNEKELEALKEFIEILVKNSLSD